VTARADLSPHLAERDRRGVPASAWAPHGGARKGLNKNLENNPMQSRVDP
jgi:hypothetical protein